MSMYLYKRHLISGPDEKPEYAVELLASNDEVIDYKDSLVDTFTTNYRLDIDLVRPIITLKDKYRLELRVKKYIPDVDVYITLKRNNIEYFLMVKEYVLALEDGYVFCGDPIDFIDSIKSNIPEEWKKFKGYDDNKIYIDYEGYEMTTRYKPVSDFPDGMSIG